MTKKSATKSGTYLKKEFLFFNSSRLLFTQVTDLFDFVWPTVAAMWNLRKQVNQYLDTNPQATSAELNDKFTRGSGGDRAELIRACVYTEWREQNEKFAIIILVNSFAIYESWVHNILKELGYEGDAFSKLERNLKKPSLIKDAKLVEGIKLAINKIVSPKSNVMYSMFYKQYLSHSKNSLKIIENLMLCYKCFKEIRNSLMHRGGIVDARVLKAFTEYKSLIPSDLGTSEVPFVDILELNEPIKIDLRGVVGFCDIILKITATLDAEFSISESAYDIMLLKVAGNKEKGIIFSGKQVRRRMQIKSIFTKISMPPPLDYAEAEIFLKIIS